MFNIFVIIIVTFTNTCFWITTIISESRMLVREPRLTTRWELNIPCYFIIIIFIITISILTNTIYSTIIIFTYSIIIRVIIIIIISTLT